MALFLPSYCSKVINAATGLIISDRFSPFISSSILELTAGTLESSPLVIKVPLSVNKAINSWLLNPNVMLAILIITSSLIKGN
jgi:hypothetical protein